MEDLGSQEKIDWMVFGFGERIARRQRIHELYPIYSCSARYLAKVELVEEELWGDIIVQVQEIVEGGEVTKCQDEVRVCGRRSVGGTLMWRRLV